jgi:dTDP-4-dehydrorhamnose 3,5-epimerase
MLRVALYDTRIDSPTHGRTMEFFLGEQAPSRVLRVPTGVAHGFKCLQGPAHMFYVTSKVYNAEDEGRIAHDDSTIGYDWLRGPAIK